MKKSIGQTLFITLIFTVYTAAVPAETLVQESEINFSENILNTFRYSCKETSLTIDLQAHNFNEEFEILTQCSKIAVVLLNNAEYMHAISLFPDSYWSCTGLTTQQIIDTLKRNSWNFTVSTTDKAVSIVSDFADNLLIVEDTERENIFLENSTIGKTVPDIGNYMLHEMIHLCADPSRDRDRSYHGFIHRSNEICSLETQRSVPYTMGSISESFLVYKLKQMDDIYYSSYCYDDVAHFLEDTRSLSSPEENPFLTEIVLRNISADDIDKIGITYRYHGSDCDSTIRYAFRSGENFFHNFNGIESGRSDSLFIVPIQYWGIESISVNDKTFLLGEMFPFGGDYPYCSTLTGRRVIFEYSDRYGGGLNLVTYEIDR